MLDNVKSKYVLKEIFEKIKNKRKLNIIKYNKILMIKLDINKADFEIYITLKKFNNKYKVNIEDIDINEVYLKNKNIGIEGLKDLVKINFNELEELNLSENGISIIDILEKANYKKLKQLDLHYNKISDIKVLEKVKFEKLEELYLFGNKISDINILENVNFTKLKQLYLFDNNISDIKVLEKVNFEK